MLRLSSESVAEWKFGHCIICLIWRLPVCGSEPSSSRVRDCSLLYNCLFTKVEAFAIELRQSQVLAVVRHSWSRTPKVCDGSTLMISVGGVYGNMPCQIGAKILCWQTAIRSDLSWNWCTYDEVIADTRFLAVFFRFTVYVWINKLSKWWQTGSWIGLTRNSAGYIGAWVQQCRGCCRTTVNLNRTLAR